MPEDRSPRIPFITDRDQLHEADRDQFDLIAETRGGVRGPFGVLLNSPEVAGRVGHLGAYLRFESELAGNERELAILTTARECECAYEWAAHEPLAREAGVDEAAVTAVRDDGPLDDLTKVDARIVNYGRELFRRCRVSTETFQPVRRHFGDTGVTELTATMGYYSMIAAVLNAFEIHPTADGLDVPDDW